MVSAVSLMYCRRYFRFGSIGTVSLKDKLATSAAAARSLSSGNLRNFLRRKAFEAHTIGGRNKSNNCYSFVRNSKHGTKYYSTAPEATSSVENYAKSNHGTAELSRMMVPSDANPSGNVHGGTIMKLVEEAAGVAANRYFYFNSTNGNGNKICAVTARLERMTFVQPVHVGDVCKVQARTVFASDRTVAVSVRVLAERLPWSRIGKTSASSGDGDDYDSREQEGAVCNRALVWMVGVVVPKHQKSFLKVNPKELERAMTPEFKVPDKDTDPELYREYVWAAQLYDNRKNKEEKDICSSEEFPIAGSLTEPSLNLRDNTTVNSPPHRQQLQRPQEFSPDYSAVELAQLMLPSDCATDTGLIGGGTILKLMDNASAVACVRHCGTNIVTVAVDSVNLMAPVLLGDVVRVQARPTFTSNKSIEFQVSVIAERFAKHEHNNSLDRHTVVTIQNAYFTFVSLPMAKKDSETTDEGGSWKKSVGSLPMRPLVLATAKDQERFEAGKRRYERRRGLRTSKQYLF